MYTYNSGVEFNKGIKDYHNPSQGKVISMGGFFKSEEESQKILESARSIARILEDRVNSYFGKSLKIGAVETPEKPSPKRPNLRYSALIVGMEERSIRLYGSIQVQHPDDQPTRPKFLMAFPVEPAYLEATCRVVCDCIGDIYAFHDVGKKPPEGYKHPNFGPHDIRYLVDGNLEIVGMDVLAILLKNFPTFKLPTRTLDGPVDLPENPGSSPSNTTSGNRI